MQALKDARQRQGLGKSVHQRFLLAALKVVEADEGRLRYIKLKPLTGLQPCREGLVGLRRRQGVYVHDEVGKD